MNAKLLLGTVGAIIGALIGAIIWAAISASTNFQIGWMAVGVGFLAGYGMRTLGGGRDRADGTVAAIVALLGCALGNVLTAAVEVAQHNHYPLAETIIVTLLKPAIMVDLLGAGFNPMD
ncbi:MAG: hypothetical protein JO103_14110, partial [Candidatus Eremiobacteraeota bacterium]|nr:hypothetical protein [Candidatus Eremiobacteraeota bacterium]